MTRLREIYKCNVCGNVVEVMYEGAPDLTCCDQLMEGLEAKAQDEGKEKHVPIIEETEKGIRVQVGGVEHPMEDEHYIKFIEVLTKDKVIRAELNPGQKPEACFCAMKTEVIEVREYCTVHNLWKA
ncbi:MAG: desulfoferrodoxin [Candidatus Omnitrophica bacterium]|nr:desulfoferrodoxin [Candidatus Omnitrophota bacterium]